MALLLVALAAPALFYAALIGAAGIGFCRTSRQGRPRRTLLGGLPSVSIVVPARNEAESIVACLEAILQNDYPDDLLEVIVVDDGSTDGTADVVRSFASRLAMVATAGGEAPAKTVALIRLEEDGARMRAHKKEALRRGVRAARGEIVLTTDADCIPAPSWIRSMVEAFDEDTGMVTGPVLYRRDGTLFGDLQALEFLGLVALGGGLVEIGRPHLCNSANLAYRRSVYQEIGGYEGLEAVSTGDDEMLMHRVAYESDWKVGTCMTRQSVVETNPNGSVPEFFRQRKRWASAHARYPHGRLTAVSVLCYLFYLEIAGGAAAAIVHPAAWGIVAMLFVLKVAVETALLIPAARRFGRVPLLQRLALAELMQIVYVLVIGAAGTFGGYEWKGRRVPQ